MYSADGLHLKTLQELQVFLIERRNEHADPSNYISLNPDEEVNKSLEKEANFKLPPIGKASYIKAGMNGISPS